MPNSANNLLDQLPATSCDIGAQTITVGIGSGSGSGTRMLFKTIIGSSHTQQFTIPAAYSYLHIKFNAILLSANFYSNNLSILVNVVPTTDLRSFLINKTEAIAPNALAVSCTSNLTNRNNHYGVYFMDYKVEASARSIIIETIPQGLTNTYLAVTSFEVYYGNCY